MKKSLAVLAAAAGFALASPASAIVVGGIDFGALGDDPFNRHLETATLAQTIVTGDGQNATAYGFITSVNGDTTYCAGGGNCGLFYVANFNNSQNWSPSYVEFTSSTIQVYFTNNADLNLLAQDSPSNLALIQEGMTPWVTLSGHANLGGVAAPDAVVNGAGTLTGTTLSGSGFGLLDVTGGIQEVADFLNANGILDAAGGLADIAYTASFNNDVLNPFDELNGLADGCADGSADAGAWCFQGTSNIRGDTVVQVPAPAPLALLAIGLFGLGWAGRSRKS